MLSRLLSIFTCLADSPLGPISAAIAGGVRFSAEGGDGIVSVTSNVVPKFVAQTIELWDSGDTTGARDLAHKLAEWTSAAFVESNPIPAKAALAMMTQLYAVRDGALAAR